MTRDEAETIAEILSGVDDGCTTCVAAATRDMAEQFPDHPWYELVARHVPTEDAKTLADLAGSLSR